MSESTLGGGTPDVNHPWDHPDIVRRFWAKVVRNDLGGCWSWTASRRNKGYGAFAYTWQGKMIHDRAHRFSYLLHGGLIPDGFFVLHTCDNPPCCNPDHLFLGNNQDNIADMLAKGRHVHGATYKAPAECDYPRGTDHHNAKLNEDIVRAMRLDYASGRYSYSGLAKVYRIGMIQCWRVVTRKHWKHVN